jgi:beta-mannosidase
VLNWEVQHPKSSKWIPLGQKGSIQEAFISAGLMPDPFVGKNEHQFAWFEDHVWILRSTFEIRPDQLQQFVDLDFPSIDTYASIYLNDVLIAVTDNAFVHYRINVNKFVKIGQNKLRVVFTPPVNYQSGRIASVGTVLPAPNDVGKIQVAPHCRKPQYQFGWDWSLRMLTMGFNEPVQLMVYTANQPKNTTISSKLVELDKSIQTLRVEFAQPLDGKIFWKSDLFGTKKYDLTNETEVQWETTIDQPILWWPRGHGQQFLYRDHWVITDSKGNILCDKQIRFGVKKVELVQEKDQWGTSFMLKINDKPIFCKGADYIPDDIFPARISDSLLRSRVQTMADCHFNMVRIWGGGFYPKESFLVACDELGIMVWQDFMFACAMYPGTDEFLSIVKKEVEQQIPRLASHASMTLFNGNNEVDVAWKNWGFQSTYKLTKSNEQLIEKYYQKLFKELLPNEVKRWTNLPYEHTSPLSNWGKDEFYRHGTQHYWGVWHGKDPIEDFGRKSGRFNAEYGFQSFPEFSTLNQFSKESEWALNSPVMKLRQKSYVGNDMIAKHASVLFGETADFLQFVYHSQLTQARAVSMAVVSHRIQFPRTTGTLYWQMNDCWPAPTWSSLDYYGNWKALQYQIKEDFADVAIVAKEDTLNMERYFMVSDTYQGFHGEIKLKVHAFNGDLIQEYTCQRAVIGPTSFELFPVELAKYRNQQVYLEFQWVDIHGNVNHRNFICSRAKIEAESLPAPTVKLISWNEATGEGVLQLVVQQTLQDLWITSRKVPMHLEKNFVNYLPGTYEIAFKSNKKIAELDLLVFFH